MILMMETTLIFLLLPLLFLTRDKSLLVSLTRRVSKSAINVVLLVNLPSLPKKKKASIATRLRFEVSLPIPFFLTSSHALKSSRLLPFVFIY